MPRCRESGEPPVAARRIGKNRRDNRGLTRRRKAEDRAISPGRTPGYPADMPEHDRPATWSSDLLRSPHTTADKAGRVRTMFNAIAPTYERVNRVFSFGRDAAWRRDAVRLARLTGTERVLDVACGTGDLARAFLTGGAARVTGLDFAHEMLVRAAARGGDAAWCEGDASWCEGDALALPFASGSFDVVSCAFGIRNFQDLRVGVGECFRVLAPGGRLVILEFSRPGGRVARWFTELYTARVMPRLATWMSGDRTGAYRYLPSSVVTFPGTDAVAQVLRAAGFSRVEIHPRTLGVVTIYVAWNNP
ncbi:MAG: Ubiquinone/menaquinone biosynthesis C-methyltransferase UbiE [Phycisphaerae bacterium]|nr:Ubiquinone/menaquinone biosynthesis C-methyltransferase UbiE [Phycisphaerae bacterium]